MPPQRRHPPEPPPHPRPPVGEARRLSIYIAETAQHHHRPLYAEIVERAHRRGLAGATVIRGIEGFGSSHHLHTTRILSLSEDLPLVVLIVDSPDRIEAFLPELDELITDGLVVIDDVTVVQPAAAPPASG